MLRRVLLAAVAFSCTLPIASAQGTPRIAQIKDLICVLVMSGMQKEDLDVSLLRKLQRYNVNIDDKNNAQLRQECMAKNKSSMSVGKGLLNTGSISTRSQSTTHATEYPSKNVNIEAVLKFLKSRQDTVSYLDQTTIENYNMHVQKDIDQSTTHTFTEQPIVNTNFLQRYIQSEIPNSSDNKREQNFETNTYYTMPPNINFKIDEGDPKNVKSFEFINKMFKNYLAHSKIATTQFTTTKQPIDIDIRSVYKQINELIASSPKERNEEKKTNVRTHDRTVNAAAYSNVNNYIPTITQEIPQEQSKPDKKNYEIQNMYDMLKVMKQFKTYSFLPTSQNNNPILVKQRELFLDPVTQNVKYEQIKPNNPEPGVENKQKLLMPNLVKEIAETVKDVIIKDLRMELSKIYFKPTSTTTVSLPTTTTAETIPLKTSSNIKTQIKETNIMNTFMELYDQIKALKQTTFVLRAHNKSENTGNDLIQQPRSPSLNHPYAPYLLLNREPKMSISSYYANYNANKFVDSNLYDARQRSNHKSPITIQTNSIEIKPLAVSMPKAGNLINQNIIINPKHNYHDSHNYNVRNVNPLKQLLPEENRYSDVRNMDVYSSNNRYGRYSEAQPMHPADNVIQNREDIIRFRMTNNGNSRFDTDYYEKINVSNERIRDNKQRITFQNRDVPRYHERLEREDDRVPAMFNTEPRDKVSRIYDDVTSRQQKSLVNIKKGSSYDETHFKNFLKTQQKVTDILEKILSNKPNPKPTSVETI